MTQPIPAGGAGEAAMHAQLQATASVLLIGVDAFAAAIRAADEEQMSDRNADLLKKIAGRAAAIARLAEGSISSAQSSAPGAHIFPTLHTHPNHKREW